METQGELLGIKGNLLLNIDHIQKNVFARFKPIENVFLANGNIFLLNSDNITNVITLEMISNNNSEYNSKVFFTTNSSLFNRSEEITLYLQDNLFFFEKDSNIFNGPFTFKLKMQAPFVDNLQNANFSLFSQLNSEGLIQLQNYVQEKMKQWTKESLVFLDNLFEKINKMQKEINEKQNLNSYCQNCQKELGQCEDEPSYRCIRSIIKEKCKKTSPFCVEIDQKCSKIVKNCIAEKVICLDKEIGRNSSKNCEENSENSEILENLIELYKENKEINEDFNENFEEYFENEGILDEESEEKIEKTCENKQRVCIDYLETCAKYSHVCTGNVIESCEETQFEEGECVEWGFACKMGKKAKEFVCENECKILKQNFVDFYTYFNQTLEKYTNLNKSREALMKIQELSEENPLEFLKIVAGFFEIAQLETPLLPKNVEIMFNFIWDDNLKVKGTVINNWDFEDQKTLGEKLFLKIVKEVGDEYLIDLRLLGKEFVKIYKDIFEESNIILV